MNRHVDFAVDKKVIQRLDVFVLAGVSRAKDGTNTDGILITKVDSLFGINNVAIRVAIDEPFFDLEITHRLLPDDLHGRRHDHVGFVDRFPVSQATRLPALLHSEHGEHDGFRRADSRGAHRNASRGMEEVSDDADATVLDISGLGIFFIVDEVFGKGFRH